MSTTEASMSLNEQLTSVGSGPMAAVYRSDLGGVSSALKVFPGRFDRRTVAELDREFAKLRALRVPAALIPSRIEQLPDGRHALRMEFCTQSLAALVQRCGALQPSDVLVLGYAAATALAAAHSVGVPHGGVHPKNVLFRPTGEAVLADFGVPLRRAFPRDPMQSIEWLSPESLRDDILSDRTDLYGLGAVLHFALTGRPPHPGRLGERLGDRVLRVLREPVPPIALPGVPGELSLMTGALLSADPARRPVSAEFVAYRLSTLLAYQQRGPAAYHHAPPPFQPPAPPTSPAPPLAAPPVPTPPVSTPPVPTLPVPTLPVPTPPVPTPPPPPLRRSRHLRPLRRHRFRPRIHGRFRSYRRHTSRRSTRMTSTISRKPRTRRSLRQRPKNQLSRR
ncbi:serine/threonine protein kinase [Fodinicola feengrottensis]|uniref:serine/threonine protein kinase n=1 Tax=Fodinicola feengrottensis TaxID=435914 RepID=UPI0024422B07|nr:protein kinase [Fodinicola feengrottensis]